MTPKLVLEFLWVYVSLEKGLNGLALTDLLELQETIQVESYKVDTLQYESGSSYWIKILFRVTKLA